MNARTNISAARSALSLIAVAVLAGSAMAEPTHIVPGGAAGETVDSKPYNPDYNHDGKVETQDIFDFLTGWFAGKMDADVNANGYLDGLDILEYINAWFAAPVAGK
ncbi:MAG TPA: GC-type dockerin domain-anchored protein [Phycisphaerales bacterium]|jgi:hypothetical protein|nr:GC-type dockerin domain-anchored protein [Phycisphaerales bacterium]